MPPASGVPARSDLPSGVELGSIGDRFLGLILDFLVLLPLVIIGVTVRFHHSHVELIERFGRPRNHRVFDHVPAWETLLLTFPGFLYVTLTVGLRGRTLGQQARRLRVVLVDGGGDPGYLRSVARWSVIAVPSLALGVAVVGGHLRLVGSLWTLIVLAWMFWDRRRQGLHDKVAGVLVVVDDR